MMGAFELKKREGVLTALGLKRIIHEVYFVILMQQGRDIKTTKGVGL